MRILLTLLSFFTFLNVTASEIYAVGSRDYTFTDTARNRKITAHVWHPVNANTAVAPVNPKGPFRPAVAALDSPVAKSKKPFPVVLMSHGSMGLANRLFWLADKLIKNGIVVIAVDHPGNMFGDSSADGLMRVWDRSKDLTFVLNAIENVPDFRNRLDLTKISAIGHSAGGTAVLLLAGARFSFDQFNTPIPNCAGSKDPFYKKQCDELAKLNSKSFGKEVIEGDYSDSRIKSILVLDPGFVRSFRKESLTKIKNR